MHIVLLPGMDGTGRLFAALLSEITDMNTVVISLPQEGPQDYQALTQWVVCQLPREDHIIIAESFSGAIAARLSGIGSEYLKGIIFVASFLSSPSPLLVRLARLLPLQLLAKMPGSSGIHRALFLGKNASTALVDEFTSTIELVPQATLKARLSSIGGLRFEGFASPCPVAYIRASGDMLVDQAKVQEFKRAYSDISIKEIDGPHFILQARPAECAVIVRRAIEVLTYKSSGHRWL